MHPFIPPPGTVDLEEENCGDSEPPLDLRQPAITWLPVRPRTRTSRPGTSTHPITPHIYYIVPITLPDSQCKQRVVNPTTISVLLEVDMRYEHHRHVANTDGSGSPEYMKTQDLW